MEILLSLSVESESLETRSFVQLICVLRVLAAAAFFPFPNYAGALCGPCIFIFLIQRMTC